MSGGKNNLMGFVFSASAPSSFRKAPERGGLRARNEKMDALMNHVNTSERHSFERVAKAVDAVRSKKKKA
jgi:hypothetical protein